MLCPLPDLDDTEHNGKLPVMIQSEYISVSAHRENKEGPLSMYKHGHKHKHRHEYHTPLWGAGMLETTGRVYKIAAAI